MTDPDVFKALADDTRRAILDSLFATDGQTLTQLCAQFEQMTRFGVMKHLAVLEAADLVIPLRQGREKRHFLNPVPIEQIANRWISRYAARFTAALVGLDEQVRTGTTGRGAEPGRPTPKPDTDTDTDTDTERVRP